MATVLFLTQVLPYPLDAGPKTRAYYVLRYLAEAGHQITLVSFVRETDSCASLDHLRSFLHNVRTVPMLRSRRRDIMHFLRSLPGATPFLIARDWLPTMAQAIAELVIDDFDFVHADQLWMAPYALLAGTRASKQKPQLVLDQHNAVFQIPRRLAHSQHNPLIRALLKMEARKLARYEAQVCQQFDHVVWVTGEDQAAVTGYSPLTALLPPPANAHDEMLARQAVIPICIDIHQQPPVERVLHPHRVTFLGGLHWPPNAEGVVWFVRKVWPAVQAQVPGAVLTVIGKDPPSDIVPTSSSSGQKGHKTSRHLQQRDDPLPLVDVQVTGYVADPQSYLRETAVFIVPLLAGGGMRVKILDAWRWGLPVVSTSIGAEGILAKDGENLLIADTPTTFGQAVVRLLHDQRLASYLAANGRRTVERYYNWRTVYQAWDKVYGEPPTATKRTARRQGSVVVRMSA